LRLPSRSLSRLGTGWAFIIAAGAAAVACPGSLHDPSIHFPECDVPAVLDRHCSGSICHSSADVSPNVVAPDLTSSGAGQLLLDKPATYDRVKDELNCPDPPELLVDTQNPEQSLLLKKLEGSHACGDRMPLTGTALANDELECLVEWVMGLAAGAQPPTDVEAGAAADGQSVEASPP
jgi:hypothetical protein